MKLSVVIPVYNVAPYLEECLDSVLYQDFNDFEVICVNDGSTDESGDILKKYQVRDKRIHVILQKNEGLSVARNTGIQYASGKYICFVDSDDMLTPGSFQRIYHASEKWRTDVLSYEAAYVKYESEALRKKEGKDNYFVKQHEYVGIKTGKQLFNEMINYDEFCASACLLLIKREWLEEKKIRFYPGIFYEDNLFVLQCFLECGRICHVKQKNYIYRVREYSIMTDRIKYENISSYLVLLKEMQKLLIKEKDETTKCRIVEYIATIVRNVKNEDLFLSHNEKVRYQNLPAEDRFITACLSIGSDNFVINGKIYLKGFLHSIEEYPKVILYGAGEWGCKMYQYLHKVGFEKRVVCFAVTDQVVEREKIEDVPVYSIYDLSYMREEALVLITANNKHRKEIRIILHTLGFDMVEEMDNLLGNYIDHELEV